MKADWKKSLFAIFNILSVSVLFVAGQAFAWTLQADFESGTVGKLAQGTSGFSDAGSATTFSSDLAAYGSKSAKMVWAKGTEGFSSCRGTFDFPSTVGNGGELWIRGYFWFPSNWDWDSSPVVKVMRIHMSGGGYHSIFAHYSGRIRSSNEIVSYEYNTSTYFTLGGWQSLEMYIKFATSGNRPIFRIWKDGVLVFEDTTRATLGSSSDRADFSYIMSNWNGGSPQTQTQYLDNFVITTEKPAHVDSKGNPMIGPANTSPANTDRSPVVIAPSSPTGLQAIPNN
jgi:hypothetical protein